MQPFTERLPTTFQTVGTFHPQPRLRVLDETLNERFGSLPLAAGTLSFKFDDLQQLHIQVNNVIQVVPMPWHEGALLKPITDRQEHERLTRLIELGELLKKPSYYDE
jgi:hypothetical protein